MALTPGTRLGPYEILAAIGAGGMGEVYRAKDSRLDRLVAIKVSKEQFSERFEREARAVAALNHPHICQLYDVGPNYLVMELVEGAPLRRVDSPATLLDLAAQIADGLMAAHASGVIHRDLKPANILVTRSGGVKILDFGLATVEPKSVGASDVTGPAAITDPGTTVGTAAYMSPEQARGQPVDARTDLWSLGVILYEMTTGVRPFDGPTVAVIFEALLSRTPVPARERNPKLPVEIARIIDRLLEKDRETRYQSAADVRADLRRVERDSDAATAATTTSRTQSRRAAATSNATLRMRLGRRPYRVAGFIALALLLVAGGITYFYSPRSPVTLPSEYVQITNFADSATAPALSPDGRMVTFIRGGGYFLSTGQIFVKLLPNGESVQLTNHVGPKLGPVFTPDGSRVAYTLVDRTRNPGSWNTWTVPVHGGQATQLLPNAAGLVWLDDRRVLFSELKPPGLHMGIVTSTEGRADHREIYFPAHERAMAHYSWASPDRTSVLLVEMDRTGAWQRCRLVPFDGSSAGRQVGPEGRCTAAAWSPDGTWMYFNAEVGGSFHLWRQRFPDGPPEQITFGPTQEQGLALAPDGESLITSVGGERSSIWMHEASGDRALFSEGFTFAPLLSLDGKRLYYLAKQNSTSPNELWTRDLVSGKTDRLVPGMSAVDFDISPDETEVAFTLRPSGGEPQVWLASLDRRSAPRQIVGGADQVSFGAGGELIFRAIGEKANSLARIKKDGSGRERISSLAILNKGRVSPDGEWVAVFSTGGQETGGETLVVAVRSGEPRRICTQQCASAWAVDGRFFYVTVHGRAFGPESGRTLAIPVPPGQPLPEVPALGIPLDSDWTGPPGTRVIEQANLVPGSDPSTYLFVKTDIQRNLFRIPLH